MRFGDPQVRGQWAEDWSVEALRKVRGWMVVDNLPFDTVDVDHVVVTPSTVLAVETKYHGRQSEARYATQRLAGDVQSALNAGRKTRLFLQSKKLHDAATVTPVLMVWGPGSPDLPNGYQIIEDVYVVDSDYPQLWSHLFKAPLLSAEKRTTIHAAFAAFAEQRHQHDKAKQGSERRTLWREFCKGAGEARTERSARAATARSLQRRHGVLSKDA